MKLFQLLTVTAAALTLSFPVFAAKDATDQADMNGKASMSQEKMEKSDKMAAKAQKGKAEEMAMKEDAADMKDNAMKEASMKEPININTADAATIAKAKLKGIGMKKAEAIVAYREKNGNFQSIDDLTHVKGINKKIIAKNKDRLTTG